MNHVNGFKLIEEKNINEIESNAKYYGHVRRGT